MKKRIGAFVEYFPPRLGGDRRIYEILKNIREDYDIHFFIMPPSYTLFIRQIESTQSDQSEFTHEGMKGHTLTIPDRVKRMWKSNFILSYFLTFIYLIISMTKKMLIVKPNILVINNTSVYTGLMGFICSKIMKKKLLVEYNDLQALYTVDLLKNRFNPNLLQIIKTGLIINEDTIVRNGWRVTAITHFIERYARARNTRKDIVVIPDGVDTEIFDPKKVDEKKVREKYSIKDQTKLCVYAGRIEEAAGGKILQEAAKLLEEDETIKFLIIGEGDSDLSHQLSKLKNIIMTGRIPKDDVPEYLASSDVILVPFPRGIASNSISPLKLFEALSMNKPVIASDVEGIREVISPEMELLLATDDPKDWVNSIKEILKTPRKEKIKNRELVKELYDWRTLSEKFLEVLES